MDILTQGVLGAAAVQASVTDTKKITVAGGCGFLAGMAPDLDVLILSQSDPLMFLEYHRHFTHALAFIPFGGFICALCLYGLGRERWQLNFLYILLCCNIGYATHGLLDASTSYGTSLFWPFSETRVSWGLVSIIDPFLTVPLAALVIISLVKGQVSFARAGLAWVALYLGVAVYQQQSALELGASIAEERGHLPTSIQAKPSFGNILVWRIIYELPETFHIDAVRVGVAQKVFPGMVLPKLEIKRDLSWLKAESQQAKDIERFRSFSQGYIAQDPATPNRIIDIRYSFVPNDLQALWSIEVLPLASPEAHVAYQTHRDNAKANLGSLLQMIFVR